MKEVTLTIQMPKVGATSGELVKTLTDELGAETEYVSARLKIIPPDIVAQMRKAVKGIREAFENNTLEWIGCRVCEKSKLDILQDEVDAAKKTAKGVFAEIARNMNVWLPKVKSALGKGAEMVELPDPNAFDIEAIVGVKGKPVNAGKGLPKSATDAKVSEALSRAKGYEAVIDHLTKLAEKVEPGKKGGEAALKLKADLATAAKIGAVDKAQIETINRLVGAVLTATGTIGRKGAKAALVGEIIGSASETTGETTTGETTEGNTEENKETPKATIKATPKSLASNKTTGKKATVKTATTETKRDAAIALV